MKEPANSVFWVTLKGNASYVFSVMVKVYGINERNSGDLQFGIVSADMKFILPDVPDRAAMGAINMGAENFISSAAKWANENLTYDRQMSPLAWDGEWKPRALHFTVRSDEAQIIGICITARNSTVYFDDMFLTEAENVGYTMLDK